MNTSGPGRVIAELLLGAYLAAGLFSSAGFLVEPFQFRHGSNLSVHTAQSQDLDGRPYWMSHKHLTSLEKFSADQLRSTAEPWTGVIPPAPFGRVHAAFLPFPAPLFSPHSLRAPPRS